jgi:hypothetical protein
VTKPLPFTENAIVRAVSGARKAGVKVGAVRIEPDGTITVLDASLAPAIAPTQDDREADNWANA